VDRDRLVLILDQRWRGRIRRSRWRPVVVAGERRPERKRQRQARLDADDEQQRGDGHWKAILGPVHPKSKDIMGRLGVEQSPQGRDLPEIRRSLEELQRG
jgi:hypothetical protein